ncbi:MAG: porin [Pacificibacter sp.]|uniref:porin n=1 Tax=Pacificibacter sp. TaxID=1917866 RepID=UPI00321B7F12
MKKILLSSAAIVAFAGAAAADVSFDGGSAELSYNDMTGMAWELSTGLSFSQELNNGWTAGASAAIEVANDNLGNTSDDHVIQFEDLELSLTSEMGGLYLGDTATAAGVNFSAPKALDGAPEADFDVNILDEDTDEVEAVLRAELTYGDYSVAVSGATGAGATDFSHVQFSASADLGGVTVSAAYQDADHDGLDDDGDLENLVGAATAFAVSTTLAGADLSLGYLDNGAETSTGLGASYTVDALTVGAYFTSNTVADDAWGLDASYDVNEMVSVSASYESDDSWEVGVSYDAAPVTVGLTLENDSAWDIDATFDAGNGLTFVAGTNQDEEAYFGASYELGGDATLAIEYAKVDEADADEDFDAGTTVRLGFTF